jgi:hypothetical protein
MWFSQFHRQPALFIQRKCLFSRRVHVPANAMLVPFDNKWRMECKRNVEHRRPEGPVPIGSRIADVLPHPSGGTNSVRRRSEPGCKSRTTGRDSTPPVVDPERPKGLWGIRGRLAEFDGTLAIDSALGAGTRVTVRIPGPIPMDRGPSHA